MNRVLPALVIGAVIAAGIIYGMALLVRAEPLHPTITETVKVEPVPSISESKLRSLQLEADACRAGEEAAMQLIDDSKSCSVDSDCRLASFGCPFGCVSSVSSKLLPDIEAAIEELSRCNTCVYMCAPPMFEWQARCTEGQCRVHDGTLKTLEDETLNLISK